jgi:hypothetical protein
MPNRNLNPYDELAALSDIPNVRWERNRRGGFEAWYVPNGATKRSQRTYLGYLGKRTIDQWRQQNILEPEIERWVLEKRAKWGLDGC